MSVIHNSKLRMPLILYKEDEQVWLTDGLDESHINVLMQPYPDKLMVAYTISKLITARGTNRNVIDVLMDEEYEGVESVLNGGGSMEDGLDRIQD